MKMVGQAGEVEHHARRKEIWKQSKVGGDEQRRAFLEEEMLISMMHRGQDSLVRPNYWTNVSPLL